MSSYQYWSLTFDYSDLVKHFHQLQVCIVSYIEQNDWSPWLGGANGCVCYICRGSIAEKSSPCMMSVQYTAGISWVHWGISWVHWGISWVHRGFQYSGVILWWVWGDIVSTPGAVQYTGVSIQIQLFSHWPSPTFIMISLGVLSNIPQCTQWYPPSVLNIPRCTQWYPPVYWTCSGVLHRHYAGWSCMGDQGVGIFREITTLAKCLKFNGCLLKKIFQTENLWRFQV